MITATDDDVGVTTVTTAVRGCDDVLTVVLVLVIVASEVMATAVDVAVLLVALIVTDVIVLVSDSGDDDAITDEIDGVIGGRIIPVNTHTYVYTDKIR